MEKYSNIITGILAISAIVVLILVIQKYADSQNEKKERYVQNWKKLVEPDRTFGAQTAKINIINFFDYRCSFCKQLDLTLDKIQKKYSRKVAITYRFNPVLGKQSKKLALLAICAMDINKFKAIHAWSFNLQQKTLKKPISKNESFIKKFEKICRIDNVKKAKNILAQDIQLANELGIGKVPTLVVNGEIIVGAVPFKFLETIVKSKFSFQKNDKRTQANN